MTIDGNGVDNSSTAARQRRPRRRRRQRHAARRRRQRRARRRQLALDVLDGGAGNDILSDTVGGDTLKGGAGNDLYVAAERPASDRRSCQCRHRRSAGVERQPQPAGLSHVENLTLSAAVQRRHRQHAQQQDHGQRRRNNSLLGTAATTHSMAATAPIPAQAALGNDTYFVDEFGDDRSWRMTRRARTRSFRPAASRSPAGQEIEVLTLTRRRHQRHRQRTRQHAHRQQRLQRPVRRGGNDT